MFGSPGVRVLDLTDIPELAKALLPMESLHTDMGAYNRSVAKFAQETVHANTTTRNGSEWILPAGHWSDGTKAELDVIRQDWASRATELGTQVGQTEATRLARDNVKSLNLLAEMADRLHKALHYDEAKVKTSLSNLTDGSRWMGSIPEAEKMTFQSVVDWRRNGPDPADSFLKGKLDNMEFDSLAMILKGKEESRLASEGVSQRMKTGSEGYSKSLRASKRS